MDELAFFSAVSLGIFALSLRDSHLPVYKPDLPLKPYLSDCLPRFTAILKADF
jgi:hypothetical protein